MKEDSLASTVSSAGTWVKRMGLNEMASTAGRARDVWGCAVHMVRSERWKGIYEEATNVGRLGSEVSRLEYAVLTHRHPSIR